MYTGTSSCEVEREGRLEVKVQSNGMVIGEKSICSCPRAVAPRPITAEYFSMKAGENGVWILGRDVTTRGGGFSVIIGVVITSDLCRAVVGVVLLITVELMYVDSEDIVTTGLRVDTAEQAGLLEIVGLLEDVVTRRLINVLGSADVVAMGLLTAAPPEEVPGLLMSALLGGTTEGVTSGRGEHIIGTTSSSPLVTPSMLPSSETPLLSATPTFSLTTTP